MTTDALKKEFPQFWVEDVEFPSLLPSTINDVSRIISWALKNRWKVLPVGSGTSISSSYEPAENHLVMLSLKRNVFSIPNPFDLTLVCEAGARARAVNEYINDSGFRIDHWPADYPGTIGGLISGDRGIPVRSMIQGIELVDGHGNIMKFGGSLRKNVSGFDLPCLFAGSRGMLGWMDKVYLRLTPLHAQSIQKKIPAVRTSFIPNRGLFKEIVKSLDPSNVFVRPST